MIAIVNYNMGNLGSVVNAFEKIGADVKIESNPERLKEYSKLILPGVGAFGDAMEHLSSCGLDVAIKEFASSGKYIMGTCLGMQLLFNSSEEFGLSRGLGLIDGKVVAFNKDKFDNKELKVPHMGWNEMFTQKSDKIFNSLPKDFYQYFVHSYHVECDDAYAIGKTLYGYEFVSAVNKENIYGFQPHPEKSHDNGLKILQNFANL
jgi:glutamine amidotransferase